MPIKRDIHDTPLYFYDYFNEVGFGGVGGRDKAVIYSRDSSVTTTRSTIGHDGIYQFPASASQWSIASTSANDTAAGTGLQQVILVYLDENYEIGLELLTMNGQTPVTTVATNILRFVFLGPSLGLPFMGAVGSTGYNVGTVHVGTGSFTGGVPDNSFGNMQPVTNASQVGVYTVPLGRQAQPILNVFGVEETKNVTFEFESDVGGNGIFTNTGQILSTEGVSQTDLPMFLTSPEKSDFRFNAFTLQSTSRCNLGVMYQTAPFPLVQ